MSLFKGEYIFTPKIIGVVSGNAAAAGHVGEVISSAVAVGSAVSLTTATAANVTSISLTPGDWDVSADINFTATGATTAAGASVVGGISTTSATLPTDGTEVNDLVGGLTTTTFKTGNSLSRKVVNVSVNTTVYLVGIATFSAGTVGAYGAIVARRVR